MCGCPQIKPGARRPTPLPDFTEGLAQTPSGQVRPKPSVNQAAARNRTDTSLHDVTS